MMFKLKIRKVRFHLDIFESVYLYYWTKIDYSHNFISHFDYGPVSISRDGSETQYMVNDELHRECGPAVIWSNGNQFYYLNNQSLTKEDWQVKVNAISI